MGHVSYTELRQNLARYLDAAVEDRAPILVTRPIGKGDVVLISAEEFAGMEETLHLLRNPANAQWLLGSVQSAQAGAITEHERVEAGDDHTV